MHCAYFDHYCSLISIPLACTLKEIAPLNVRSLTVEAARSSYGDTTYLGGEFETCLSL